MQLAWLALGRFLRKAVPFCVIKVKKTLFSYRLPFVSYFSISYLQINEPTRICLLPITFKWTYLPCCCVLAGYSKFHQTLSDGAAVSSHFCILDFPPPNPFILV